MPVIFIAHSVGLVLAFFPSPQFPNQYFLFIKVVAGIQSLQTLVRLLYYLTSLLLRKNSIKMEMLKTEDPAVGCSIIPSCSVKMW